MSTELDYVGSTNSSEKVKTEKKGVRGSEKGKITKLVFISKRAVGLKNDQKIFRDCKVTHKKKMTKKINYYLSVNTKDYSSRYRWYDLNDQGNVGWQVKKEKGEIEEKYKEKKIVTKKKKWHDL